MEVLIIGLGSIANKHITAIQTQLEGASIYALRSGKKATDIEGIKNIFSFDDIPATINFAIISNPTNLHADVIVKLSNRGIPMIIEKPSLHSLENALEIAELLKKNNSFTYVACNLRFHPCIQFIQSYINNKQEKIQEVNVYCGSYLPNWRPNVNFREVYSANLNMGGGVHLDLIHELDYTYWLFGKPNNSRSFISSKSNLGINAPDYANYLLEYNNFNASIILNYYRRDTKRSLEIVFDDCTLLVDLVKNIVIDDSKNILYSAVDFNIQMTYNSQIKYFTEMLSTKQKPMNTFEDSLDVLYIALSNG